MCRYELWSFSLSLSRHLQDRKLNSAEKPSLVESSAKISIKIQQSGKFYFLEEHKMCNLNCETVQILTATTPDAVFQGSGASMAPYPSSEALPLDPADGGSASGPCSLLFHLPFSPTVVHRDEVRHTTAIARNFLQQSWQTHRDTN